MSVCEDDDSVEWNMTNIVPVRTWLILSASARHCVPSRRILFHCRSSVVSVCQQEQWNSCPSSLTGKLTRFTFNTSARCAAATSSRRLWPMLKLVSVCEHRKKGWSWSQNANETWPDWPSDHQRDNEHLLHRLLRTSFWLRSVSVSRRTGRMSSSDQLWLLPDVFYMLLPKNRDPNPILQYEDPLRWWSRSESTMWFDLTCVDLNLASLTRSILHKKAPSMTPPKPQSNRIVVSV